MASAALFFVILLPLVHSQSLLNNYIIGTPTVNCEENEVSLDIITAKPFEGNIFVKGKAKDSDCKHSYNSNATKAFSLGLGKCGMQRLRSVNPRGISFTVTLIVSFHPFGFITKNDRAFHIKCFYMEPDEIVTNEIHVSALPTYELQDEMGMPQCQYSVHLNSVTGPLLSYANVGDTVYHVWECTGPSMGMLVKKCHVTDGDGEEHPVIDDTGCSLDSRLLDEVVYEKDSMKAYAQSQVFKYADSNQLYFTCQIRLCQLKMDMCDKITPPKCSRNETESSSKKDSTDVNDEDDKKLLESVDDLSESSMESADNKTISRLRRSDPHFVDLDVTTGDMLIMDEEQSQKLKQMCYTTTLFPLIPVVVFFTTFFSVTTTILISRQCMERK